jgi:pilus assembly protein TadC
VIVAAALGLTIRRIEPHSVRVTRAAAVAQLPIAAELLAAALRAGASPDRAATVVGEALGGPVGQRLVGVGRGLRVGLRPAEAWAGLSDIPGADRMIRAVVRSADSGAALTSTFERISGDLRVDRDVASEASVHRVAVLSVLPLGLCFLPAFLLTGVVPVVVAVLGDVYRP